jgi:hypothetical protein
VFTAEEPANVDADKYDTAAVAMIALLKYGTGMSGAARNGTISGGIGWSQ